MSFPRFLIGRFIAGLVVLWAAATLTFLMMHMTGGDTAIAILGGPDAMPTAAQIARVRAEYGLDQPLIVQYGDFLHKLVLGDLGESYRLRIPVVDAIAEQIWPTITLAFSAAVTSVVLAVLIAVTTARRGKLVREAASTGELLVIAMPTFVIGLALLMAFAVYLPIFPVANAPGWRGLVLPALSLALPIAAMLAQVLRQELEDVLEQPFILTARSRGLSDMATRLQHALRHAATPVITLSGFVLATLLGGAAVTEALFARPGIGRLMVEATSATDVPVVVGITLFGALVYVIANLIVDVVGALIDPRTAAA